MDNNFFKGNLASKRIFITGGTGFFGKNLIKFLIDEEIKPELITILSRNPDNFKRANPELLTNWLTFISGDIQDLTFNSFSYDYFIHAATSVVDQGSHTQLVSEIVNGTKQALDFAKQSKVQSFINISSGAVYGQIGTKEAVVEDELRKITIDNKASSYGLGKLLAEHYSYLYANKDMKVTSLRCFCFGGPYLDSKHYALGDFIDHAINNKEIVVQAGSGVYRSYLSTIDLARWIFTLLIQAQNRAIDYDLYNVGSDQTITIPELASKVVEVLNSKSIVKCPNNGHEAVSFYIPNISKAVKSGLLVNDSLESIIQTTATYYINKV